MPKNDDLINENGASIRVQLGLFRGRQIYWTKEFTPTQVKLVLTKLLVLCGYVKN